MNQRDKRLKNLKKLTQKEKNADSEWLYQPDHKKSCFFSGLPKIANEKELKYEFAQQLGDLYLEEVKFIKNKDGDLQGFGFVQFQTTEDSQRALGRTIALKGRYIELKKVQTPSDLRAESKRKVIIKNLPPTLTEVELEKKVEKISGLINCTIFNNKNKNPYKKKIGCLEFINEEFAENCLKIGRIKINGCSIFFEEFVSKIKYLKNNSKKCFCFKNNYQECFCRDEEDNYERSNEQSYEDDFKEYSKKYLKENSKKNLKENFTKDYIKNLKSQENFEKKNNKNFNKKKYNSYNNNKKYKNNYKKNNFNKKEKNLIKNYENKKINKNNFKKEKNLQKKYKNDFYDPYLSYYQTFDKCDHKYDQYGTYDQNQDKIYQETSFIENSSESYDFYFCNKNNKEAERKYQTMLERDLQIDFSIENAYSAINNKTNEDELKKVESEYKKNYGFLNKKTDSNFKDFYINYPEIYKGYLNQEYQEKKYEQNNQNEEYLNENNQTKRYLNKNYESKRYFNENYENINYFELNASNQFLSNYPYYEEPIGSCKDQRYYEDDFDAYLSHQYYEKPNGSCKDKKYYADTNRLCKGLQDQEFYYESNQFNHELNKKDSNCFFELEYLKEYPEGHRIVNYQEINDKTPKTGFNNLNNNFEDVKEPKRLDLIIMMSSLMKNSENESNYRLNRGSILRK